MNLLSSKVIKHPIRWPKNKKYVDNQIYSVVEKIKRMDSNKTRRIRDY